MAGKSPLYGELARLDLLEKAMVIIRADGSDTDKSGHLQNLLVEAGSAIEVTPKATFYLRHRLEKEPPASVATTSRKTETASSTRTQTKGSDTHKNGQTGKKPLHPHDGRKGNRAPPGPHSTGFTPGNDAATVTGRHRNPLLRGVSEERRRQVSIEGMSPKELLEDSIEQNRILLGDLNDELETVKASPQKWVWLGSTYTRQEGDGALMGTGRISQRKRMPRLEAITRLTKDIAAVQRVYNKMVKDYHDMQKGAPPEDKNAGLNALAETIKASKELLAQKRAAQGGDGK